MAFVRFQAIEEDEQLTDERVARLTLTVVQELRQLHIKSRATLNADEEDAILEFDEIDIVAAALWARIAGVDNIDDVQPACIGSVWITGFTRAFLVMQALSDLDILADFSDQGIPVSYPEEALLAIDQHQNNKAR